MAEIKPALLFILVIGGLITCIVLSAISIDQKKHFINDLHYLSNCDHTIQPYQPIVCSIQVNCTCPHSLIFNYSFCDTIANGTCMQRSASDTCIVHTSNKEIFYLSKICNQTTGTFCKGCLVKVEDYSFVINDPKMCNQVNEPNSWGKCATKEGKLFTDDPNKHLLIFIRSKNASEIILAISCCITGVICLVCYLALAYERQNNGLQSLQDDHQQEKEEEKTINFLDYLNE